MIMNPSFYAMFISASLTAIGLLIILNIYSKHQTLTTDTFQKLMLILGFSIAIGIHGLAHAYAEVNFNYNPLIGKITYNNRIT